VHDYTHKHTNMHTYTYWEHNGTMSLSVIPCLSVSGKALHFVLTAHKLCRHTHTHTRLAQAFPFLTEGGPE